MATAFWVLGFIFLTVSGVMLEKSYQQAKMVKKLHEDCKELWADLQKERRKVNGDDVNEFVEGLQLNQK